MFGLEVLTTVLEQASVSGAAPMSADALAVLMLAVASEPGAGPMPLLTHDLSRLITAVRPRVGMLWVAYLTGGFAPGTRPSSCQGGCVVGIISPCRAPTWHPTLQLSRLTVWVQTVT